MGAYYLDTKQSEGRLPCPHCGSTDCAGFNDAGDLICCMTQQVVTADMLEAADHALYWHAQRVGTIVLPQGGTRERIVGIVIDATTDGMNDVLWISDQRGVFRCFESPRDLTACNLSMRGTSSDEKIVHLDLVGHPEMAGLMDRRETAWDPFDGSFDEQTMTGVLYGSSCPEDDDAITIHCHWEVCDVCDGNGSHVNPSIDSHGLTQSDFDEDPDFEESYRSGVYDVPCHGCGGRRVQPVPDDDDPNFQDYVDAVQGHHEYLAERQAEMRMGA